MFLSSVLPAALTLIPVILPEPNQSCATQQAAHVQEITMRNDSGCVIIQELSNGRCLAICNGALSLIDCDDA